MCEDQDKVESDKQFFAEQRAALENERRQLTDAAVKLGHEVRNITNKLRYQARKEGLRIIMRLEVVSDHLKLLFGIEVTSPGYKLAIFSMHNLCADGNSLTLNLVEPYTEELGVM